MMMNILKLFTYIMKHFYHFILKIYDNKFIFYILKVFNLLNVN